MSADRPSYPNKHILILCFSHLAKDARVLRQVESLRDLAIVSCGACSPSGLETGRFVEISKENTYLGLPVPLRKALTVYSLLKQRVERVTGNYRSSYWTPALRHCFKNLNKLTPDVIIANDLDTLPLAMKLAARRAKVIFDAHEFYPQQHIASTAREISDQKTKVQWCRTLMPMADRCLTVSDAVADAYEKLVGVRPVVLTNAPAFADLEPTPVNSEKIRLVHHGAVSEQRRSDELIQMMDHLGDAYELHLFPVPDAASTSYLVKLQGMAAERANVIWHDAVPPGELPQVLSNYDIGVHSLPPTNLNHAFALPNKVFDFVQARLALVVSPNPAMAAFVRRNKLGVVSEGSSSVQMAGAIKGLSREDILKYKWSAHTHAHSLSSRGNMELLRTMVSGCLNAEVTEQHDRKRSQ